MNLNVRFIGSLIKYFIYLCVILIAAGAALFWFDTGSWLVRPLAERAGSFFLDPVKLEIDDIAGSLRQGYSLRGLRLVSGDEAMLTLDYASVSPDWDMVLDGMNGIPYIQKLELRGISSDLDKVLTVASLFTSSSKDKASKDTTPFSLRINPANIAIHDVNFGTPYANLSLDALTLSDTGRFRLAAKILSRDNELPIRTNAKITLTPIEVFSSEIFIGRKSTGAFSGTLEPIKARLDLTALSLDELLKFAPPLNVKASGRIDGRIFVSGDNVSGVVSMPRANVMDVPFNFRLPFAWDGHDNFSLTDARLNTDLARVKADINAEISSLRLKAKGEAMNISLNEIGRMFAPEAKLDGEGGSVIFDVDAQLSGDILSKAKADVTAGIPYISAQGMRLMKDLSAHVKLTPGYAPRISLNGEVFRGKLFARGEALQEADGTIKPQAVISLVNLDIGTAAQAVPAAAKSVKGLSGKVTATAKISDTLDVEGRLTSDKITAEGITITNLLANLGYHHQAGRAELEGLSLNLGKGLVTASGGANLKDTSFTFKGNVANFEPRVIPQLRDVTGIYGLKAEGSGRYSDLMGTIKAAALLTAHNAGYSGFTAGDINLPVSFADKKLAIQDARASLPGGSISLKGLVNLQNMANPGLDITASTQGINIAEVMNKFSLQNPSMPLSGRVRGNVSVKGPLNTASVNASLKADSVKAGDLVNMPSALLEVQGNMKKVTLRKLEAKVNSSDISGSGTFTRNQKDLMNSGLDFTARLKGLELKPLLLKFMETAPAYGTINAEARLKGTINKPKLDAAILSPIYSGKMEIEDIKASMTAPEPKHYSVNTKARIGNFRPEADIDIRQKGSIWTFNVDTKPLDIDSAIETQMPAMAGLAKGYARVHVDGSTKAGAPINIKASSKQITILDKIKITDINLPAVFKTAQSKLEMTKGTARLSDGIISSGVDVDLDKKSWKGSVNVSHLDFGKLAGPFLPEGELIGSVDSEIEMKGRFGVMATSFADGRFETTPGYFHKMALLERITPTGRISFEKISGTFFWNGSDIFLNPGTGARAGADEPLYRYVSVNGSAGLPGKGLRLLCDGRFDLKILDQLLGAMKGVFQYMTGGLTKNIVRDAAGRVLGLKSRDFQNISFTLANSWQELRLLDLKITKPIEDFLPIDILNRDSETQKDSTQFKLQLKIPTGPGDKSVEEESTTDQFKRQLLDNLLNMGL